MQETGYWERLRKGPPLFQNPIFRQDDAQAEAAFFKDKFPGINDTANVPIDLKDSLIMKIIRSKNSPLETLKIFGSSSLRTEYCRNIFDKQIKRGRLTEDAADKYLKQVKAGGMGLFFQDAMAGFTSHWIVEKATVPAVNQWIDQLGQDELLSWGLKGWYFGANFLAMAYFLPRALWEYRLLEKTADTGVVPLKNRLLLAGSVVLNALPILSATTTPLLNYQRYEGFGHVIWSYHLDNAKESFGKLNPFRRKASIEP